MRWNSGLDRCFYCDVLTTATPGSAIQSTKDHVFPVALGGGGSSRRNPNIVIACAACNRAKGSMHPREWYWKIKSDERREAFRGRLYELFPQDIAKINADLKENPEGTDKS